MTAVAPGSVSEPPELGKVLAGKYRVDRVLGRGGMGVVFAAHHLTLGGSVAVKVLSAEAAKNPVALTRFRREGRAAAKIRGEHVAQVHDVDVLEDGSPYIVMELLEGNDLVEEQHVRGTIPLDDILSYVLQTCEAVAGAHAAGIVHRDLKPGNLFLARQRDGSRVLKVLDFGISKMIEPETDDSEQLTVTTAFEALGSPVYMSPEQMRSTRDVDHRTDIWSLGVLLYKLLTGQVPFPGKTVPDVCARILVDATPSARALRPDTPEAVDAVIRCCLAKSPHERYQSVGELAAALAPAAPASEQARIERILSIESPAEGRVLAPTDRILIAGGDFLQGDVPTIIGKSTEPAGTPEAKRASGSKAVLWVAGSLIALAVLLGLFAMIDKPAAPREAPRPAEPPKVAMEVVTVAPPQSATPVASQGPPPAPAAHESVRPATHAATHRPASVGPVPTLSSAAAPPPKPVPTAAAGDEHPLHL